MDWICKSIECKFSWYEIMNVSVNSLKSNVIRKLKDWMKNQLIKPIESDGVKSNWMNVSKGIWL